VSPAPPGLPSLPVERSPPVITGAGGAATKSGGGRGAESGFPAGLGPGEANGVIAAPAPGRIGERAGGGSGATEDDVYAAIGRADLRGGPSPSPAMGEVIRVEEGGATCQDTPC